MKNEIKEYLENKGLFDKNDLVIIEELVYNVEISGVLKADIESEGIVITTSTKYGDVRKLNPSFQAYQLTLKNIKELSTKLALTVQERSKLKLIKEDATQLEMDFHEQ